MLSIVLLVLLEKEKRITYGDTIFTTNQIDSNDA